jgi:CO/xanthine dehydrogenase Mo-binding subunit
MGIWRSVGHSYNAFAVESMIDEVAAAAGEDPIALRLSLLGDHETHRAVLERVRELSGWDAPPPEGRARGVAVHACYESFCAQVAEVSVAGGSPRVHRVWAAVECGQTIDPGTIEAQVQGGIVFGLSAALHGRIDLERGRVVQSNFHDYPVLRMDEMPEVEVAILDGDRDPGGVGELAVPPIAPAVCNALFALTGRRPRRLPIEVR